jgi:shikimate dehydrogenase
MSLELGLIGFPLSHSFSPAYFKQKFAQEGIINRKYSLFELPELNELTFKELIISHPQLCGINVTIPYKQQIIPLLDEVDETAAQIGAVNTITIERKNTKNFITKGYNTDIEGIRASFASLFQNEPLPSAALILGTGGSSRTVAFALRELKIPFHFVSREKRSTDCLSWDNLNPQFIATCPLIINTTPVGMYPNIDEKPPLPLESIGNKHFVLDLIYNPDPSLLLQECSIRGAKVLSGKQMLITQAEFSYKIWQKVF